MSTCHSVCWLQMLFLKSLFINIRRCFFITSIALARSSFRRNKIYLLNHFVNNVGSFIFGYIYVMIWKALSGDNPESYFMMTYVMINQAGLWITTFLPKGAYLPQKVVEGTIAYEFIRPYSILFESFFETLGHIFYNFIFKSIPLFFFGVLLLNTQLPNISNLIPYFISLFNGFLIAFFLNYFVCLWTIVFIDLSGAHNLYFFLINTFGGNFISLE